MDFAKTFTDHAYCANQSNNNSLNASSEAPLDDIADASVEKTETTTEGEDDTESQGSKSPRGRGRSKPARYSSLCAGCVKAVLVNCSFYDGHPSKRIKILVV